VPGGQNPDWHSDNATNHAAFWDHRDHQDRVIWLWSTIAARYRANAWVAGYNVLNEPCDAQHDRLPAFYERIEAAVRAVDPEHVLWLDGNTFAMEWRGFDRALPNSVYGLHDYSTMGFPKGVRYAATPEQKARLEQQFLRKAEFMHARGLPVWNGEFGPVYANARDDGAEWEAVNDARYGLLGEQLRIYDKYRIHWSIWLYKDIGLQGMVHAAPESKWMRTIAGFLEKKKMLQLDAWGRRPAKEVEDVINPLVELIDKYIPQSKEQYPTPWATERQIVRLVNQIWMAGCLNDEFAELFRGMGMEELEECARSFHFDECVQRGGLNRVLEAHASAEEGSERPVGEGSVEIDRDFKLELD
jgi:hypothetical protein